MLACSFKNCTNVDRKSNCRFFHFPLADSDQERCRQWIELSGNDSLYKLNKSKLGKVKVCSAHFRIDQILESGRLQPGSLPSPYQRSPNKTNKVSSTGTASGPSTALVVSQPPPERDTVPPFIIVHEIVDVTIDLIDEDDVPDYAGIVAKAEYDVDDEGVRLLEEDDSGSDIITLPGDVELVAETGAASNTLTSEPDQHFSDIESDPINQADATPEILEECDPLAMEVEDNTTNNAERPLFTTRFAEAATLSDAVIFNDIGHNQPDELATQITHYFEPTDNEEIPTVMKDMDVDKQVTQTCSQGISNETLINSKPCVIKQLLATPFCLLSKKRQGQIVDAGRPMPIILHEANLTQYTWITGSNELKKLFCWPCLLFSRNEGSVQWSILGYDYLQDCKVAILTHKTSRIHKQCSMTLSMFKKADIKDPSCLELKKQSDEVKKDRDILQRIIDSVCLLAKLNIPFRSCEDGNSSLLHGTYLAIIKGLSEYDLLLKQQLEAPNACKFTSSTIQDGLIIAIRTVLINKIKQEVEESKFVSIILCRTSETINGSQLSVVLRYVDKEGDTQERFIGHTDVGSSSALFEIEYVAQVIVDFKIQEKLVSVSYSGPLAELCTEIKVQYPRALIINNQYENQLSSIFRRAYSSMKECRLYVATMTDMAKFFSSESIVKKLNLFIRSKFQNSPTFSFFYCLEKAVCICLPQVFAFFKDITENPKNWNGEAVLKAQAYLCFFEDFSNMFFLITFARVFTLTTRLDRLDSCGRIHTRERFDKKFRDFLIAEGSNFFHIWEDLEEKRRECNLEPEPVQMKRKIVSTYSRIRESNLEPEPAETIRKKIFTYSRKPSELEDPKNVYLLLFRKIFSSFTDHMEDHLSSVKRFQFDELLNLSDAEKYRSTFPIESFEVLQNTYPGLLNWVQLKCQLASLYRLLEYKDISQLELMALMKIYDVENVMPEVYALACLFSTIPPTSPSKEISNSAINRIKHLSETLGQRRMSNLTLLSIENNFLSQLKELPNFYSDVLDVYAKK